VQTVLGGQVFLRCVVRICTFVAHTAAAYGQPQLRGVAIGAYRSRDKVRTAVGNCFGSRYQHAQQRLAAAVCCCLFLQVSATAAGQVMAAATMTTGVVLEVPRSGTPTAQATMRLKSGRAGQTLAGRSGKTLGGGGKKRGRRV
jgi:hypothetical protein